MVDRNAKSEFKNDSLWRRWIEAFERISTKNRLAILADRLAILMAVGRKTVLSWIRATEVQHEFKGIIICYQFSDVNPK